MKIVVPLLIALCVSGQVVACNSFDECMGKKDVTTYEYGESWRGPNRDEVMRAIAYKLKEISEKLDKQEKPLSMPTQPQHWEVPIVFTTSTSTIPPNSLCPFGKIPYEGECYEVKEPVHNKQLYWKSPVGQRYFDCAIEERKRGEKLICSVCASPGAKEQ